MILSKSDAEGLAWVVSLCPDTEFHITSFYEMTKFGFKVTRLRIDGCQVSVVGFEPWQSSSFQLSLETAKKKGITAWTAELA